MKRIRPIAPRAARTYLLLSIYPLQRYIYPHGGAMGRNNLDRMKDHDGHCIAWFSFFTSKDCIFTWSFSWDYGLDGRYPCIPNLAFSCFEHLIAFYLAWFGRMVLDNGLSIAYESLRLGNSHIEDNARMHFLLLHCTRDALYLDSILITNSSLFTSSPQQPYS